MLTLVVQGNNLLRGSTLVAASRLVASILTRQYPAPKGLLDLGTFLFFAGYKVSDRENPADFFIDLLHTELPAEVGECLNVLDPSVEDMRKYQKKFPDENVIEKQQVATSDQLALRLQCVFYSSYDWIS
ncbi:unnamed protein product [Dibothriocephalus latus]|uniref:Uncharacterized protein n=1 Tax=Dibothriocephalus latus TaxID=60516 RepID=A0A3P7LR03_DIBLA|nr:unnamed protein product [Dibothriocephalus latus]